MNLYVLENSIPIGPRDSGAESITLGELRDWAVSGKIFKKLLRYQQAVVFCHRVELVPKAFFVGLLVHALARGACRIEEPGGRRQPFSVVYMLRLFGSVISDVCRKRSFLRAVAERVRVLERQSGAKRQLPAGGRPVYLRTDLFFGILSGGSVGHIAGVLNNFEKHCGPPLYLTTDRMRTVSPTIETHVILPERHMLTFEEMPVFAFNDTFLRKAREILQNVDVQFFYQRYGIGNFCGVELAESLQRPLVLEYNGSEVWIQIHWGRAFRYEKIALEIELLNLRQAELIIVVSEPLREELLERGIPDEKILVNPNGVDPQVYHPDLDGSAVRRQLGLENKTIVGFIGTFGRWHGAEKLAEAFGILVRRRADLCERVRLLLIGDGITMPEVRAALAKYHVEDQVVLTGLVPQEQGPAHLAACDILVSPHVPNADGSKFFGSPTKLFEYMAMGRGIVASDLDQIGAVLSHNHTAYMVRPGDVEDLARGLEALLDDAALRERLGRAARAEVVRMYTWEAHTLRILEKLRRSTNAANPSKP